MCLPVLTASDQSKRSSPYCDGMCACSVTKRAILTSDEQNFLSPTSLTTKGFGSWESQNGFIRRDTGNHIPNAYLTSRQDDTRESEMQKGLILWKNGMLSSGSMVTGAFSAVSVRS